jgi:prevent-host-death family protein
MRAIGVRELKVRTSEVLRRVREQGETIDVTYRGEVVARLVPVRPPQPLERDAGAVWTDLDRLAAEIGAHWPPDASAPDAVSEGRREL